MKSIDDIEVAGRRVLVRSDLNVPLDKSGSGAITDDGRIRASLPVIKKLADRGARVIVMAHLGRPKGEDFAERAAGGPSLRVVADRLSGLLGKPVAFASDLVGPSATATVADLADGDVALLENVRFEPAETSKDESERLGLAQDLAKHQLAAVGKRPCEGPDDDFLIEHKSGTRVHIDPNGVLTIDASKATMTIKGDVVIEGSLEIK